MGGGGWARHGAHVTLPLRPAGHLTRVPAARAGWPDLIPGRQTPNLPPRRAPRTGHVARPARAAMTRVRTHHPRTSPGYIARAPARTGRQAIGPTGRADLRCPPPSPLPVRALSPQSGPSRRAQAPGGAARPGCEAAPPRPTPGGGGGHGLFTDWPRTGHGLVTDWSRTGHGLLHPGRYPEAAGRRRSFAARGCASADPRPGPLPCDQTRDQTVTRP